MRRRREGSAALPVMIAVSLIVIIVLVTQLCQMSGQTKQLSVMNQRQAELIDAFSTQPEAADANTPPVTVVWAREIDRKVSVAELGFKSDRTVTWRPVSIPPPDTPAPVEKPKDK